MTELLGLGESSPWTRVVRRPPVSKVLAYLVEKWHEYEQTYSGVGEPFATRTEPQLTEGLGAYLDQLHEAEQQPFDGQFFAELSRVDLGPDGKRIFIGRSDIEWRLHGFSNFIVEFKIIGGGRPASKYVTDGMMRFVDARYGHRSVEGAMWAFFLPHSVDQESHVEAHIDANLAALRCQAENGSHRVAPSSLAPGTARFDSLHARDPVAPTIRLAHVFVKVALNPSPSPS
jgi:hypothetical protein